MNLDIPDILKIITFFDHESKHSHTDLEFNFFIVGHKMAADNLPLSQNT